ncbi:hypothetical protein [Lactococcus allomyrinae]|uniref:hypothetical protein n=1 Tax=Lactococcus allomyrinae TaxID=2419773 RepID=UPI0013C47368|nr:hypothetical protein [Lactococcus allomyrinae]
MKTKSLIPAVLGICVALAIPVSYSLKTKFIEVKFSKGGLLNPELYNKKSVD